ncbi:BID domain-containing T4SS effector [Bartonella sp. F02]|uniref:BID domain-containing T4SS effector n=1 Tax=Bartonella sp. F02 TaxID=2967262 RepID=UPI0022A9692A|nr:BID domain-containing T4SS effector [Bartonella sp. F02]MCZ2328942.1 BID domain-containing T4SS effector [Bartonella sp. F02]
MKKAQQPQPIYADLAFHNSFFIANTGVLKNKYNIKDAAKLQQQCERDARIANFDLQDTPIAGPLDSNYLKTLHHRLHHKAYEWAGQTRNETFRFEDGTRCSMPTVTKYGIEEKFFAKGPEVTQNLKELDKTLKSCHYFKGSSYEEFVDNAWQSFIFLEKTQPFVSGNDVTHQVFLKHLANAAGYDLDFSVVSKKHLDDACRAAIKDNDFGSISRMFADMSDPERVVTFKEAVEHMKGLGIKDVEARGVSLAVSGQTYTGTYVAHTENSAIMRVNNEFIVLSKDNLNPEQIKAFKFGDEVRIQALTSQALGKCLIPEEDVMPLTKTDICQKVEEDVSVKMIKANVQGLSQVVYGNPNALDDKLKELNYNPELGSHLAQQISENPKAIGALVGKSSLGFKSQERKTAENSVVLLSETITSYAHIAANTKGMVMRDHQAAQERGRQEIRTPSQELQKVLNLDSRARQTALEGSTALQKELRGLVTSFNERLSPNDRKAIREGNHKDLAQSLGTSVMKAEKIVKICKQSEQAQHDLSCSNLYARVAKPQKSKAMSMAS